jgi:hypothetical protein
MTHDPFQTYTHYGVPSPLGLQYPSQPSAINPVAALNAILGQSPMAQAAGIPQVGPSPYGMNPIQSFINPQQLQQLASLLALQNPLLAASFLSNPLIAAGLHSQAPGPYGVPQFGLQSQMGLTVRSGWFSARSTELDRPRRPARRRPAPVPGSGSFSMGLLMNT